MSTQPKPLDNVVYEADPAPYPLRLLLWTVVVAAPAWLFAEPILTPLIAMWRQARNCGPFLNSPCLSLDLVAQGYVLVCSLVWTWGALRIIDGTNEDQPSRHDRIVRAMVACAAYLPYSIFLLEPALRWLEHTFPKFGLLFDDKLRSLFHIDPVRMLIVLLLIYVVAQVILAARSNLRKRAFIIQVWWNVAILIAVAGLLVLAPLFY